MVTRDCCDFASRGLGLVGFGVWSADGRSVEVAVGEVVFIKAEVVAEFVEKGSTHFFAIEVVVFVGVLPDVFEKKDDLGGEVVGACIGVGEGFANEEAEGVGFNFFGG